MSDDDVRYPTHTFSLIHTTTDTHTHTYTTQRDREPHNLHTHREIYILVFEHAIN